MNPLGAPLSAARPLWGIFNGKAIRKNNKTKKSPLRGLNPLWGIFNGKAMHKNNETKKSPLRGLNPLRGIFNGKAMKKVPSGIYIYIRIYWYKYE